MPVVELRDRHVLAAFLRHNAQAHVYELGDLDDFDWPFTRWFGWEADGRLEQVTLLYTQPDVPVLIAIAEEPSAGMVELVRALLPALPASTFTSRPHSSRSFASGMRSSTPSPISSWR